MLRIVSHIEQLLQKHDCVIVPEFGGFVSHVLHTMYDAEKHVFTPTHKEVVFNGSLRYNDGLLTESYMQEYGIDFKNAQEMVDQDTATMQMFLAKHGVVQLGRIGKLNLSATGELIFEPGTPFLSVPGAYGLSSVQLKTLQILQQEEAALQMAREKETARASTHVYRRLLQGVATTAAAVALFFLVSTPVTDVERTNAASMLPKLVTISMQETTPEIQPEEEELSIATEEQPEDLLIEESKPEVAPVVNKKMYHIIIGSFVTDKQADEFIDNKVDPAVCPNVNKIVRGDRIRVYANRFDNREEAEQYLETIRTNPKYQDAWLFISR
ncbi:MAG: SPOR domain-containing protein [Tannerellaceae bacterium]|nr:SPOR domain-containing protein [Tannerellaceae bacterium]